MCGIAGFFSEQNSELLKSYLHKMIHQLAHRGPDHEGLFYNHPFYLSHRRLSIIDLSPSANQPMFSGNGRYVGIFNGEIYNYKKLAESYGIQTKTSSDTEVAIEMFSLLHTDAFQHFNGMFAMAIFDREKNTLILARDRIGIKPLYYYWDGENLAFASEIKALLVLPFVQKNISINRLALQQYFNVGFTLEPYTIFNNIYKFPAGYYAVFQNKTLNFYKYWSIFDSMNHPRITDEKYAQVKLDELLHDAVAMQLRSDVPYGVFLSGGTDSSLVTAIASHHIKQVKTFSIGFKNINFDESPFAEKVAKHLSADHHTIIVNSHDIIDYLAPYIETYDEPFADSAGILNMILSQKTREHVTMVLSGDGGDELFWGYGAYNWANRLAHPLIKTSRKLLAFLLRFGPSRYKRASHMFDYSSNVFLPLHILSQEQYFFSLKEISNWYPKEKIHILPHYHEELQNIQDPVERQSVFDLIYYLKDDLLIKVDRASMLYALEVRVPILDHRIVEFAYQLHPSLKKKDGISKYIFKKILFNYLPSSLFDRPKKGFAFPYMWFFHEFKEIIMNTLHPDSIKDNPYLPADCVQKTIEKYYLHKHHYLWARIWIFFVFHLWFEKNKHFLTR
ncbi:MAG: asparagine synthase (glutamine-hydrolyzing) [Bacteroidales bacterium]|nr:asparagine synthase (glutamine-hydrolyzing) [Bacteroidales bacterium]